jgi:hypothetical protein
MTFLLDRCSKAFMRMYLDQDLDMPMRVAKRLYSSFSGAQEPRFLARLKEHGWLSDECQEVFLEELRFIALSIPDAAWLDIDEVRSVLTLSEYDDLLEEVRNLLALDMEKILSNWRFNEQGDSIAEYYQSLVEALDRYAEEFAEDEQVLTAIQRARVEIEERVENAEEDEEAHPSRTRRLVEGVPPRPARESERSIFDDIDS